MTAEFTIRGGGFDSDKEQKAAILEAVSSILGTYKNVWITITQFGESNVTLHAGVLSAKEQEQVGSEKERGGEEVGGKNG